MAPKVDFKPIAAALAEFGITASAAAPFVHEAADFVKRQLETQFGARAEAAPVLRLPEELLAEVLRRMPTRDKLALQAVSARMDWLVRQPMAFPVVRVVLNIRDQRESQWRWLAERISGGADDVEVVFPHIGTNNRRERATFQTKLVECLRPFKGRLTIDNQHETKPLETAAPLLRWLASAECELQALSVTNMECFRGTVELLSVTLKAAAGHSCNLDRGEVQTASLLLRSGASAPLLPVYTWNKATSVRLGMRWHDVPLTRLDLDALPKSAALDLYVRSQWRWHPEGAVRFDDGFDFACLRDRRLSLNAEWNRDLLRLESLRKLNLKVSHRELPAVAEGQTPVLDLSGARWPCLEKLTVEVSAGPVVVRAGRALRKLPELYMVGCNVQSLDHLDELRTLSATYGWRETDHGMWDAMMSWDWAGSAPHLATVHIDMPRSGGGDVDARRDFLLGLRQSRFPRATVNVFNVSLRTNMW